MPLVRLGCAALALMLAAVPPLLAAQGRRVSGQLITDDNLPLSSAGIVVRSLEGDGTALVAAEDVQIFGDGRFVFHNVAPGRYEIRARAVAPGRGTLFATFRITVADRDIANLQLRLIRAATLRGRLGAEGTGSPLPFERLRVRTLRAEGGSDSDTTTGPVAADGTFALEGLMAGRHVVRVEGLEDPWVLHSVTYRGRDVTDDGIDLRSRDSVEDVRVLVTNAASELTGLVLDGSGTGVPGALVVTLPSGAAQWNPASRRMRTARTDGSGRYRIRGLPPGNYRLAAALIDESRLFDTGAVQALAASGSAVVIRGPEPHAADIRLASKPPRADSRP